MDTFIFVLEIIGTVAFASSGAMIAIEKKMDIFGVNILGATTAVGGGMMRDIILGITPPTAFAKPRIPNFILQPLIENAIIHGLEPKLEKGTLRVQIKLENEAVAFCIADNGVGMSREEIQALYEKCEMNDTNQNIGLKNVYRRLILCYGETSRLHIESEKHRGTKIKFILPMTIIGQQEEEN